MSWSLSERNKMYSFTLEQCRFKLRSSTYTPDFFQYIQTATLNDPGLPESVDGELRTQTANSGWVLHRPQLLKCQLHRILFMLFTCVTSPYSHTSPMKARLLFNITNKKQRPRKLVY